MGNLSTSIALNDKYRCRFCVNLNLEINREAKGITEAQFSIKKLLYRLVIYK